MRQRHNHMGKVSREINGNDGDKWCQETPQVVSVVWVR